MSEFGEALRAVGVRGATHATIFSIMKATDPNTKGELDYSRFVAALSSVDRSQARRAETEAAPAAEEEITVDDTSEEVARDPCVECRRVEESLRAELAATESKLSDLT